MTHSYDIRSDFCMCYSLNYLDFNLLRNAKLYAHSIYILFLKFLNRTGSHDLHPLKKIKPINFKS